MKQTPLWQAVTAYCQKNYSRYHMPGHKGRGVPGMEQVLPYDVTEVKGTDSLFEATEAIAQTEKLFSKLYHTNRSMISCGGSTLCIQAMLALVARPEGKVIAGRNIHVSAVNAMALLGLNPVWVYPKPDAGTGLPGRVQPADIESALAANPDAAAVYLTSPDYYGVLCDIAAISVICKTYNVPLLVDNAHGSHLAFLSPSLHPIAAGADLCSDSLHKTLPALTGSALLQIGNSRFAPIAKEKMSLFGSTSPSYLMMLSMDGLIPYLQEQAREDFARTAQFVRQAEFFAEERGFSIPKGKKDPVRISLGIAEMGYTGASFGEYLREKGIEPEYVNDSYCVLLPSPLHDEKDQQRLLHAISSCPKLTAMGQPPGMLVQPRQVISLREAMFSQREELPVEQCAGRVAAQIKSPCPPGIPIVMNGELIDENIVKILKNYGVTSLNVVK